MIKIRPAQERGYADHGWLKTYYSFSFADYHDPEHMNFRTLRVMNNDTIEPSGGFGSHPHRDMEIITYVMEGALEHKDSMGNGSVIRQGDLQKITAGTGIVHSEFNPSENEKVRLYQIWIIPKENALPPAYFQTSLKDLQPTDGLTLVASNREAPNVIPLNQDADIYHGRLIKDQEITYNVSQPRGAWLQVLTGSVELNGQKLTLGDGAAIEEESSLKLRAAEESEILLFDLN